VTAPTKLVLGVEEKKRGGCVERGGRGGCVERGGWVGGLRNGMDGEWGMRIEGGWMGWDGSERMSGG